MDRHRLVNLAVFLAVGFVSATSMAQAGDGVLVISDYYDPYGWRCGWDGSLNKVLTEAWCTGSYCDNMLFQCTSLPTIRGSQLTWNGQTAYIRHENDVQYQYGWTSDENTMHSPNAVCQAGWAMTGMYSTGNYSDNVRAICMPITGFPSGSTVVSYPPDWTGSNYVTDDGGGVTDYSHYPYRYHANMLPANSYISGAACQGSYCKYMWYGVTTVY